MAERPLTHALVRGVAAVALAPVLDEQLRKLEAMAQTQPHARAGLPDAREAFAAIRQASDAYVEWLRSDRGRADLVAADMPASSTETTFTAVQASDVLGVSDRQVRRLAKAGALIGWKHGTAWVLDRLSVLTYSREEAGSARYERGAGGSSPAQPRRDDGVHR